MADVVEGQVLIAESTKAAKTWKDLRNEVARTERVNTRVAADADAYETRTGFKMPEALAKDLRQDFWQQETAKALAAEAEAVKTIEAAKATIAAVRTSSERLLPPSKVMAVEMATRGLHNDRAIREQRTVDVLEQTRAGQLIDGAAIGWLLEEYLRASDTADWAFVAGVEEAVAAKLPKFTAVAREDLDAMTRLRQAIQQRQRARWPQWTREAEAALKAVFTVQDEVFLRLKQQRHPAFSA